EKFRCCLGVADLLKRAQRFIVAPFIQLDVAIGVSGDGHGLDSENRMPNFNRFTQLPGAGEVERQDAQPRLPKDGNPRIVTVLLREGVRIADQLQCASVPALKEERERGHSDRTQISHERTYFWHSLAGKLCRRFELAAEAADVEAEHLVVLRQ